MADEEPEEASPQQEEAIAGPSEEVVQTEEEQEPSLRDIAKQLQGFQRELGRFRGLQSQIDTLPKTVGELTSKQLEKLRQEQYFETLTPEARLSYQQQQEGQKQLESFLEKFLEQKAPGLLGRYNDFTKTFERMSGQLESQDYFDQVAEALGEDAQKGVPVATKIFNELKQKVNSSDPTEAEQAIKQRDLYISNPHAMAMAIARRMQAETTGAVSNLVQGRREGALKSATVPRGGSGNSAPARLTKAQMNDAKYMEQVASGMDTDAFEKLLQRSRA